MIVLMGFGIWLFAMGFFGILCELNGIKKELQKTKRCLTELIYKNDQYILLKEGEEE